MDAALANWPTRAFSHVDTYGELRCVGVEAFAEGGVVAGGVLGADQWPVVDVAPDGIAGPALVEVWAYGWGEDVLALGDADPDPDRGQHAFAVVPVDVGPDDAGKGLVWQVGDQSAPFFGRDGPGFQGVSPCVDLVTTTLKTAPGDKQRCHFGDNHC
jgi:hypothetical protein